LVSSVCPLQVAGVTNGMGQGRLFFTLARRSPRLAGWMFGSMKPALQKNPDAVRRRLVGSFSAPDRAFFSADPDLAHVVLASLAEAMRPGSFGLGWDAHLLGRPWNFRLADIAATAIVWHGAADTNAPVAMGNYLAQAIPHARSRFFPDEGHLSILKYLPELIVSL
jgi:pimeloyl-ACP methyl ester carboxylesterase